MITVETREQIRRAYFIEKKCVRQISRKWKCSRHTVNKAIASAEPARYTLTVARPSPILGPYKAFIDQRCNDPKKLDTNGAEDS